MLKVNIPEFELSDISNISTSTWKEMTIDLSSVASGGGRVNKSFLESCEKLLKIAFEKDGDKFRQNIQSVIDIRACTYQWLENDKFVKAHPVNSKTLQRFNQVKPKLSFLPIYNLIQLFFKRYDESGDLESLIEFLHSKLDEINNIKAISNLDKLNQHKTTVINTNAYKDVALLADRNHKVLSTFMYDLGIEDSNEGRFTRLTYGFHYINKLKTLDPISNQSILAEVVQSKVTEMAFEEKLLGHHFIEAICSNVKNRKIEMPEKWLQTILTIAGDPRVSQNSARYQRWWALISRESRDLVYERLSGFDLKLFLEALDEFAKSSFNSDLKRMFPKRRKFLEGLLEQKLIRGARLFVSYHADQYLRRNYRKEELPNYATVSDNNTSIIYLKLDDAHIVEGSHMHRFWIYKNIKEGQPPTNYNKNHFSRPSLSGLKSDYPPWFISHNGFWQATIIEQMFKMGIKVNPELMLDDEDYRTYRRIYGVR